MERRPIWTVGHSNHELGHFLEIVKAHRIDFVIDVRSHPFSRFAPHFNRDELQPALESAGLAYLYLGRSLGGRPDRDDHYDEDGHALYDRMASRRDFNESVDSVIGGAAGRNLVLMCSCGKPQDCHRRLLIGRVMTQRGVELRHILPHGDVLVETDVALESLAQETLFGHAPQAWRSARSVSRKPALNTSSTA